MDESTVRSTINSIVDPCSAGRGVPIGLADMGLVRSVQIEPDGVQVVMRLTSPGCTFAVEFDTQIRHRLRAAGADRVHLDWDFETFDWSPDDIEPASRERMLRYRDRVRDASLRPAVVALPHPSLPHAQVHQ
jgi:metal-sulfur cluster biosynthetic enzyme